MVPRDFNIHLDIASISFHIIIVWLIDIMSIWKCIKKQEKRDLVKHTLDLV